MATAKCWNFIPPSLAMKSASAFKISALTGMFARCGPPHPGPSGEYATQINDAVFNARLDGHEARERDARGFAVGA